jgi:RNA polymerase sigma factor (sigma-70 family)
VSRRTRTRGSWIGSKWEDGGLAGRPEKKTRTRRHYRPTLEGLEAVRLLSGAAQTHPFSGVAVEHDLLADSSGHGATLGGESSAVSSATWDAALVETELAQILNPGSGSPAPATSVASSTPQAAIPPVEARTIASGLSQLNKYLTRAWYRAGISAQLHDDNSQAVYATLLQHLGRNRFDSLIADVGQSGIQDVFNPQTSEGLTFFRAIDMIKKRAQRERVHQSLDQVEVSSTSTDQGAGAVRRHALQEAIAQTLSPREAALIQDTLSGKTPSEIASQWGVAPKTVSNEKSRVLQKLREALADHEMN